MNKILMYFILSLAMISGTMAACVVPTENAKYNSSTVLCTGTYTFDDAGLDGAIQLGKENITLDCNGSTIIGNGTSTMRGIQYTSLNNILIKNCVLKNFNRGIYIFQSNNSIIKDNTLINISTGIYWALQAKVTNNTILNNTIINSSNRGISISINNSNFSVNNNYITGSKYGIYLEGTDNRIYDNILNNNTDTIWVIGFKNNVSKNNLTNNWQGIEAMSEQGNYSLINYNRIINCSWNCIKVNSHYVTVNRNYLENSKHNYIDSHNDVNISNSGHNNISNNYLIQTESSYAGGDSAMFLQFTQYDNIFNNTIISIFNSTDNQNKGIIVDGGNQSIGNLIYNNTLIGVSGYCLQDTSNNSVWQDNILDCGLDINTGNNYYLPSEIYPSFKNTISNNGKMIYLISPQTGSINSIVSINESSSIYHLFNLSNSGIVRMIYSGRKDLTVTNNSIKIRNMGDYSNTLINSSGTYQDITATELNQTIRAGKCVDVIYYTSATDPKIVAADDACGLNAFSYAPSTRTLSMTCTNGTYNLTNLNTMDGSGGYVTLLRDGIYYDKVQENNYTLPSCSTWTIYPSGTVELSGQERQILIYVLPLVVLVGLLLFIIDLFINGPTVRSIIMGTIVVMLTVYLVLGIIHTL